MKEGDLLNQRYQLLERLGSGGMAEVFRARDLMLERSVALKVLRTDYSVNEEFQERFRQEARTAANLSHPNIVAAQDFGSDQGQLFIVMEYVPGTDLKTLLRKRGHFTVEETIPLMVQACAGLGYAHRAGLVHCNVKPHTLLITPDMRLKVTNFSIARALSTIRPGNRDEVVWGSPQYFSPEQAKGMAPSPASDVYSLGVVMYEMLTGTLLFNGSTVEELARKHIESRPRLLSEYLPDVPPRLEQIEAKILSKEPSARYRTADQLGRVLLRFGNSHDKEGSVKSSADSEIQINIESQNDISELNNLVEFHPNQQKIPLVLGYDPATMKKLRVFLCYATEDKFAVRELYEELKSTSWVDPWLNDEKLIPGQDWDVEIYKAIRDADAIIICLSRKSVSKEGYVQKEIKRALDFSDEKPESTIYIIPLRFDECEVPVRIKKLQWVDYFAAPNAKEQLIKALRARAEVLNRELSNIHIR